MLLTTFSDSLSLSKDIIPRTTPALPKLITSDEKDEKDVQYYNTDGSSDEESDSEDRSKGRHMSLVGSKVPQMSVVVTTSDLFGSHQGLKLLLPGSPSSYRSSHGSFGEDDAVRALAIRPQNVGQLGTSPSRSGAIPIPPASPRSSYEGFGASPRDEAFGLAPDEHGNPIPPSAHWTKINRRLVSPTVLEEDHRRYEA